MFSSTRTDVANSFGNLRTGGWIIPAVGGALLLAALACLTAPRNAWGQADTGTISGTVTDAETGEPLPGVNVVLSEEELGAATKADGGYEIEGAPAGGYTVRARFVGYRTAQKQIEIAAGEVVTVNFRLKTKNLDLDEVVVTGTAPGAGQKRSLGNAVAQIDADDIQDIAPVQSMDQLLSGRIPGGTVPAGGGYAGSGSRLSIRGRATLALDPSPVVYVDGVRVTSATGTGIGDAQVFSRLNDINPADIKSVEVIKGPAAATLYGTEASSGVIQIITKRGQEGGPQVGLKVRQGASWFRNAEDRWFTTYGRNPDTGELISLNLIERERERGAPVYRTGHLQSYGLNVSGGTESVQYYTGVDFNRDEGYEKANMYRSFNGRANVSVQPVSGLDIQASTGFTMNRGTTTDDAIVWDGYSSTPSSLGTPRRGWRSRTPESVRKAYQNYQEVRRFTGSLKIEHEPTGWFTHRLTTGVDFTKQEDSGYRPRLSDQFAQFYGETGSLGFREIQNTDFLNVSFDYGATGSVSLTDKLTAKTSVGTQYYLDQRQFAEVDGEVFPASGLSAVDATARQEASQDFVENATLGVYVQEQFSWEDRIFLTGAVRADDNTAFGEEFDLVTYPKLSAAWAISEESFWTVPYTDDLKLRAAWGASGQQPEAFSSIRRFRSVSAADGNSAIAPGNPGNPDLKPERGEELEVGFELSMFEQRLGLDFTYYDQTTTDLLFERNAAPSTGFGAAERFVNLGELSNQGVEVLLTGRPVEVDQIVGDRPLTWDLSLSLSHNENEVVSLGEQEEVFLDSDSGTLHREGFAPASYFVKEVVSAEFDDNGNPTNVLCNGGSGNDPVPCDEAPRVFWGERNPPTKASFSSTLRLGNFRLYGLVEARAGHKNYNTHLWFNCSNLGVCRENFRPTEFSPERIAEIRRAGDTAYSYAFQDGDFIRLRELALSYQIPRDLLGSVGISRASLTVAGRNLGYWSEYTGLDPEVRILNRVDGGWGGRMPLPSQFETTLNVEF